VSKQEGDVLSMMLMKMMKVTLSDKEEGERKGEKGKEERWKKTEKHHTTLHTESITPHAPLHPPLYLLNLL
jgi:hypothetical protein